MSELVIDAETVYRQRTVTSDPTNEDGLAAVTNAPSVGQYGIVTREALDGPQRDAFGRFRISEAVTLFDSQGEYDTQPFLFNNVIDGAGTVTHDAANSAVNLNVTTASGDLAMKQTKEYFRYQPGKSQLILITFQLAAKQANMTQEVGYGDAANGIFLRTVGTATSMAIRSSTSGGPLHDSIAQADWNIDAMDGTGPSGVTLDLTKSQILVIDFEWLGVGAVRVGFNVDGVTYYVHKFVHANDETGVYMTTANLPVRWRIETTGATAADATLKAICCSVVSEAGFEERRGLPFSVATPNAGIGSITTTEVPILAIRPAATFNSIVNRSVVRVLEADHIALDTPAVFRVYYNPAVNGGAWAAVSTGQSAMEYNVTATSITGGHVINVAFVPAAGASKGAAAAAENLTSQLPLTVDADGLNPQSLAITAVRLGGAGTVIAGSSFTWREYR
jgi:hypothetical protein